jgi:hypothetical protein
MDHILKHRALLKKRPFIFSHKTDPTQLNITSWGSNQQAAHEKINTPPGQKKSDYKCITKEKV